MSEWANRTKQGGKDVAAVTKRKNVPSEGAQLSLPAFTHRVRKSVLDAADGWRSQVAARHAMALGGEKNDVKLMVVPVLGAAESDLTTLMTEVKADEHPGVEAFEKVTQENAHGARAAQMRTPRP